MGCTGPGVSRCDGLTYCKPGLRTMRLALLRFRSSRIHTPVFSSLLCPGLLQHLCYCGEKLKGRYTLAKHWHGLMRQVSALGDIVLVVDKVDHQPLAGAVSWAGRGAAGWFGSGDRLEGRVGHRAAGWQGIRWMAPASTAWLYSRSERL